MRARQDTDQLPGSELGKELAQLAQAAAQAAVKRLPGWHAMRSATYDGERGSLHVSLDDGSGLTMASDDREACEQVCALAQQQARMSLAANDTALAVIAHCGEAVAVAVGIAALSEVA